MLKRPFVTLLALTWALPLCAHEFWIDPVEYQVAVGDKIEAHHHVGSDFKGPKYGYLEPRTTKHAFAYNNTVFDLAARSGDRPAMQLENTQDGLVTLIHETNDSRLTYREWQKFINFIEHKDFVWAAQAHRDRGLPETDFVETYRRHAKSLVAVGSGTGQDVRVGMAVEIVALANPYTDDLTQGLPLQVWFQDAPRADAQVELFEQTPEGTINVTLHRTGADGTVRIPVKSGYKYMVDHVALLPLNPSPPINAVWHSAWANLTFRVP